MLTHNFKILLKVSITVINHWWWPWLSV